VKPPIVVARRFDRLGARLTSMVNARTVASALELDFRFVWLREGNSELEDPAELFDGAFLDHHEISSGSLDGMTPVIGEEVADLEYRLGAPGDDDEAEGRFADLVDPFTIWGLGRGADEEAQARFVDSFRSLGWNEVVSSLMSVCAKQDTGDGWTAVHLRAGDIVTGEWRHIMHHEKYTPLAYVEHAIEQLGLGDANALILSDSEACVDHLRARYERLVVPSELLPGYDRLTESQRALAVDVTVRPNRRPPPQCVQLPRRQPGGHADHPPGPPAPGWAGSRHIGSRDPSLCGPSRTFRTTRGA